jgi:putative membrane protein
MKKTSIILVAAVFAMFQVACNNQENATNTNAENQNEQKFDSTDVKRDADYAMEAASGGMMEVELGRLAMTNAASNEVKEFGNGMVTDHSKANEELKSLAVSKNITLPTAPNSDMQRKIDELSQKKGADFDKAYIDLMVDDHKDDIDLFQKEADKGNDADIKSWASGKIPTLQHHLHMAEEIQQHLKK